VVHGAVFIGPPLPCIGGRRRKCYSHLSAVFLQVLNDVVVDRGLTSFVCILDVYVGSHLVTTLQGDGLYHDKFG